ncbi:hypothetical protein POF45_25145 [Pseudomonas sp. 681]|jgi:hypothetical protein|uniref:CdiI immunity protein domain-containing protein n=1 Tax=Pseudomonas fungipugnans TaxID=3024217 RepID=A0ABT6QV35_9PSED|nr:hypothetical protein [Pseudomonas sp. 681]MDI2594691.1 hypothetical protein [Pseudomonas sp. 681]
MIKHPFLDIEYKPSVRELIGVFDVYDREETLGEELDAYDINQSADRKGLAEKYIVGTNDYLSYRHKFILVNALYLALQDREYDFQALLEHDCESTNRFPDCWDEMDEPRKFFEDIYEVLSAAWNDELKKANLEDRAAW